MFQMHEVTVSSAPTLAVDELTASRFSKIRNGCKLRMYLLACADDHPHQRRTGSTRHEGQAIAESARAGRDLALSYPNRIFLVGTLGPYWQIPHPCI